MKLSSLYSKSKLLKEGFVDIHVQMAINNVLKHGKVTDTFQYIAIARMIEIVKCGYLYFAGNFFEPTISTSKVVLDELKALDSEKLICIVNNLNQLILSRNEELAQAYCNKTQSITDWLNYVYSREVNE